MTLDIAPLYGSTPPQRCSCMAHIFKESQFYLLPMHSSTNETNHTWLCITRWSWSSFTDPGGLESWVGLGTTIVCKQQSARMWWKSVISCSDGHTSLGNWKRSRLWVSNLRPLGPKAATLTGEPTSHQHLSGYLYIYGIENADSCLELMMHNIYIAKCMMSAAAQFQYTGEMTGGCVLAF